MKRIVVREFVTVQELAGLMDVKVTDAIGAGFRNLGLMLTIDQRLDFDQITRLADVFDVSVIRRGPPGATSS